MAAPSAVTVLRGLRGRPLTTSRVKLSLHFAPIWLITTTLTVFTGVAIASYLLHFYLLLLVLTVLTNVIMWGTAYDMKRTGDYWYVPFSSHPEHRSRR